MSTPLSTPVSTPLRPAPAAGAPKQSRPPLVLLVLAAAGVLLFLVPLVGLVAAAPWRTLGSRLATRVVVDAAVLSLVSSVAAAAVAAVVGIPLAWVLARVEFPGRSVVRSLVLLPMVLPPVVGGTALLFALGRRGVVGGPLHDATGLLLPYSLWGVVLANAFVATPLLVLSLEGALRSLDDRYEAAARTMGARPLRVFVRVTLPLLAPALVGALAIAWARALGEFGATVTFAGNLQGRTQTLPLAVFVALESDRDTAVAVSLVLVALSLGVLVALRRRWWPAP
ncbi:MAG TPA: molybdate ABC transporter permease subunit [Acidimicrobiaceae bacterium]|nr:molybdate ABC transporter permease subunit [Acidimicrobiaceae bacterium]